MEKRIKLPVIQSAPIESIGSAPVIIRGHHLGNYRIFYKKHLQGTTTPSEFAYQQMLVNKYQGSDREYVEDVLGLGAKQQAKFLNNTEKVFSRFTKLSDNHPAELVEGVPDDICRGCAIGNHCRKAGMPGIDNIGIMSDRLCIDDFISYADLAERWFDRKIELSAVFETAQFLDSPDQQVRRIITTIGSLRTIMAYYLT